ncbi:hypothetical protein V6N11_078045 [Hibiscus sabdariffa]|uniref:Uncharacterized protein n=1 Tax=Hibiscus sabdariffa TaxID=183260 RepID=A0ABR2TFR7_9ROSI
MVFLFREASVTFLEVWSGQGKRVAASGCGESSVVVFLCWDRTKDMAIYSDNKARSEHHLWWTVVKWFGSEIRRNVSEITICSS